MGTDLLTNPWVYGPFAVIGLVSTVVALVLGTLALAGWWDDHRARRREIRVARHELRMLNRQAPAWMREGL